MIFDEKVPLELKKLQEWFATIITRPISSENEIMSVSPSGKPITEEAKKFIVPSKSLKPFERIQIYNQQYWWRLLGILHDNFPLTVRLFGYYEFNQQIGFPYLTCFPPSHWSLSLLGNNLYTWVKNYYFEKDKELILNAVLVDFAYTTCFFAAEKKTVNFTTYTEDEICFLKLQTQPNVHLFDFPYDFFSFRFDLLKEDPNYWLDHDFPKLKKGKFFFILYRNNQNYATVDRISFAEFKILKLFQEGVSIDTVCEWIESQNKKIKKEAETEMQKWFQKWGILKILTTKK